MFLTNTLMMRNTIRFLLCSFFFVTSLFAEGISYQTKLFGVKEPHVLQGLKNSSQLLSLQGKQVASLHTLRKRAEEDLKRLLQVMHYYGFYDAQLDYELEEKESGLLLKVCVQPGSVYTLQEFAVVFLDQEEGEFLDASLNSLVDFQKIGLKKGQVAWTQKVLEAQKSLQLAFLNRGYPLAKVRKHEAVTDSKQKTLSVTFYLEPGPFRHFGSLSIEGLNKVSERFIKKKVLWKEGEIFSKEKVSQTQKDLMDTGLFHSAHFASEEEFLKEPVDLRAKFSEKKYRSIGAALSYSTHQGIGTGAEWEHRNIAGEGERLQLSAEWSEKAFRMRSNFLKKDFLKKGQNLSLALEGLEENIRPYSRQEVFFQALLQRRVSERLSYSYGTKLEQQRTVRSDNDRHHTLLSLPAYVEWKNAEPYPELIQGKILRYSFMPTKQIGSSLSFLTQKLSGSYHRPLNLPGGLSLGAHATIASIVGAERFDIPAPHRLYAGSENALRGYAYQTVSPTNDLKEPLGGRSQITASLDLNALLQNNLSLATFFDFGHVFEGSVPKLDEKFLRSWGLGLHYHTPLGPLKLDIAFPLDKREGIDQNYQIYLSMGKSF